MKLRRTCLLQLAIVACMGSTGKTSANEESMPGVSSPQRAHLNYMLNCQGCHGPRGAGVTGGVVPAMENYVGNFLSVEGGREFLVRVPGSANSPLNDAELAELLNWVLWRMSSAQLPRPFLPYTTDEVASYRQQPLVDVDHEREVLVERVEANSVIE